MLTPSPAVRLREAGQPRGLAERAGILLHGRSRTKQEILWRMNLLRPPDSFLRSMFNATETKIDMRALMDGNNLTIINNSLAVQSNRISVSPGVSFNASQHWKGTSPTLS